MTCVGIFFVAVIGGFALLMLAAVAPNILMMIAVDLLGNDLPEDLAVCFLVMPPLAWFVGFVVGSVRRGLRREPA
jgi:hypothetical protein